MLGFSAEYKPKMWKDLKKRVSMGITEAVKCEAFIIRLHVQYHRCRTFIISFINRECD
jgi:hypothetical protein